MQHKPFFDKLRKKDNTLLMQCCNQDSRTVAAFKNEFLKYILQARPYAPCSYAWRTARNTIAEYDLPETPLCLDNNPKQLKNNIIPDSSPEVRYVPLPWADTPSKQYKKHRWGSTRK